MTISNQQFHAGTPLPWDRCPWPYLLNEYNGGKHCYGMYLPPLRKFLWGGGDIRNSIGNESGCRYVFTYNPVTDTWLLISGWCGAPGTLSRGGADQEPWAWDPKRNVVWTASAGIGGYNASEGTTCVGTSLTSPANLFPDGSTIRWGIFTFDAVGAETEALQATQHNGSYWTLQLAMGDQYGINLPSYGYFWYYDSVGDALITISDGIKVGHLALTPAISKTNPANIFSSIPFPPGWDGREGYTSVVDMRSVGLCVDPIGRCAYLLVPSNYVLDYGNSSQTHVLFWKYDLDLHTFTRLTDPPNKLTPGDPGEMTPVWDSRNRAVLYPYTSGWGVGLLRGMYVYDTTLATPAWQSFAIGDDTIGSPTAYGNVVAYDAWNNVMMMGGSAFGDTDPPYPARKFFLWRYK